MKVVVANFSNPFPVALDFDQYWRGYQKPSRSRRMSLLEQPHDWGFHIFAIPAYMLDLGLADEAEFWDYRDDRFSACHPTGVRRVSFFNERDVESYLRRFGAPDLFINYGQVGHPVLELLAGRSFRVQVPCLRAEMHRYGNYNAECYLVDGTEFLDARSMLYVPVVHTGAIFPKDCAKERDLIYLAGNYAAKRHDLLVQSMRGTTLTGHLHPVDGKTMDLAGTALTTSNWYERDVAELLRTSRIAVYPADRTSNPAAMWECVAAGLPIVINADIEGGKHLLVPGVTGEFAAEADFRVTVERVLANRHSYCAAEYFRSHWSTIPMLDSYLKFFQTMGLRI